MFKNIASAVCIDLIVILHDSPGSNADIKTFWWETWKI